MDDIKMDEVVASEPWPALPYDDLRATDVPDQALLDFFQTTYEAGANLAGWKRDLLERRS